MEVSCPPASLGPKTAEFINDFASKTLKAFKEVYAERESRIQNQSNVPFEINLN